MKQPKETIDFVCPHCGSDYVAMRSKAYWSRTNQKWIIATQGASDYSCCDCGKDFIEPKIVKLDEEDSQ